MVNLLAANKPKNNKKQIKNCEVKGEDYPITVSCHRFVFINVKIMQKFYE